MSPKKAPNASTPKYVCCALFIYYYSNVLLYRRGRPSKAALEAKAAAAKKAETYVYHSKASFYFVLHCYP
jgi:hypothetical protein